ncbi:chromosome segregation protein SMC [Spiribacter sp. 221]|uniref:chromosome segregation protein SMC n=1 Tax=Spiribacter onubensis TaxID=3122420 RepID=UPI00349F22A0
MRLSRIRLNGFKSFVDSTPVPLPGGITAIVGPNGCGKSNIIDAVRWVMGESSAKHLRGGSMADVIFSGSGSRKPVGQASIELVFDNADGSLGGQYAAFAEIAVRRQVNRDGQSVYYLNGSRCRRRDITDVFLGTGLGPRSYSIIEQGTISRLIEAKPEELRAYLEEAAGISLYKERRRETERRMRDTRENLERLEDVRDEVSRQLDKLSKQAETAERYRGLKDEERQRRAQLLILRIRGLEAERARIQSELVERNNALEARLAEQRRCEREITSLRASQSEASDRLNAIQGRYYQLGSDIARLEQRISHNRQIREDSRRELTRIGESIAENTQSLEQDREKQRVLDDRLATLQPELAEADAALGQADALVAEARRRMDESRAARDALTDERVDAERRAQVERTRIEQLEARQLDQQRRSERVAGELASLTEADTAPLDALRSAIDGLMAERADLDERIERLQVDISDRRNERDEASERLASRRTELGEQQARLASLETLQEAALGAREDVAAWLARFDLDPGRRLADRLDVEPGWELALEMVLGEALQAVEAGDDQLSAGSLTAPASGRVMLFQEAGSVGPDDAGASGQPLAGYVRGADALIDLLAGVHAADNDAEARALLASLPLGHSVVTRDGHWHGHHWLRLMAVADNPEAGVVARRREIDAAGEAIARVQEAVAEAGSELARQDAELEDLDDRLEAEIDRRNAIDRDLAAQRARLESEQAQMDARRQRLEALQGEAAELREAMVSADAAIREARERLQGALAAAETAEQRQRPLEASCESAQAALDEARENAASARDRRHDLAVRLESAQTARQSMDEAIARLERQRSRYEERREELQAALDAVDDPEGGLENERQERLARRVDVEGELTEARRSLEETEASLRRLDQERMAAERAVTELRDSAESARHRDTEAGARLATQQEQLDAIDVNQAEAAEALPEQATEADWEVELERLDSRIRRLGPINLAAIDEHRALAERKGYLDEQQSDLAEALETLQSAIQRIDRETRARFRETFDKVNSGLQRLFPRLFGGGEAFLEMTEDDLLETGVTIMARPPGKRITNIHLLSGGEKALAAVSLVFAIFELNPAPFCMLDEVDAPLDEANVGRFCDLLREMSARVQFIVITHNKTTMEAASHLAGVTMAEPGVSRLVAVDVESAVEMATADA